MRLHDELAWFTRPVAGGIHTVSSGREAQVAVQRRFYGAASEAEIVARWKDDLEAAVRIIARAIPAYREARAPGAVGATRADR